MALHPEIQKIVDILPPASPTPPDPVAHRAAEATRIPPVSITDLEVDDALAEDVPVRVYTPAGARGVIIYLHGGAFFSGSLDTHDHLARALARESGHTVVAVDYRLAPEHPYPAGLEDAATALRWAVDSDLARGGSVAVAGDSSGATFAAVLAAEHPEVITHQILYYPSLDLDFDLDRWPSLAENATGYGLEYAGLAPFNSFYLAAADPADPRVSPINRENLSGLPRALVITAQFDPLRDEGEAYAHRLAAAGVPVTLHRYLDANHGFVANFSLLPEFAAVFRETGEFLA